MWNRESVKAFLEDKGRTGDEIAKFNAQADKVCDSAGDFNSANLDGLIGPELAREFESAWETNPKYALIAYQAATRRQK